MQKSVTPATVIVALLILAVIVVGIWYFTMGKKGKKSSSTGTTMKQPTTPEAAKAAGYGVTPQSVAGKGPGQENPPPK